MKKIIKYILLGIFGERRSTQYREYSNLQIVKLRYYFNKKKKISHSFEDWKNKSQIGELDFHMSEDSISWRHSKDFREHSQRLFENFELYASDWEGKTVLDLGAGSMLRTKYFNKSNLIAIEPLGEQFVKNISGTDLNNCTLYSVPAEQFIEELDSKIDLLVSINVLDHCYEFKTIINNIYKYLKDDGLGFLSFDEHYSTDEMHPLILNEEIVSEILISNGFLIKKITRGFGKEKNYLGARLDSYGHAVKCLNFYITKK
mgnify:CR=1 FL=1